ncbi:hypothetical protein [Rhizobium sp. FY34]|uniref:hypothetical protein n=1 Tax=Rhizobium sp. FY34 TaxID=2562309 RepID=UPI0010C01D3B|nr:hypothetical protein [Rhizobium sp. FY34]
MLFGRSVFQSILTRLDHEQPEEEPVLADGFRISGLPAGFVAQPSTAETVTRADAAYRDLFEDDGEQAAPSTGRPRMAPREPVDTEPASPAAPVTPELPPHLARLSEAEVRQDLALKDDDGAETLTEKRRAFARDNHPDCVHPLFRDRATVRMTLANMLIDQALKVYALRRISV